MALQNKIVKARDNLVTIIFSGVDLTLFTKVEATFGADARDSVTNPTDVVIASPTELQLKFGSTSETQANFWLIVGFDALNVNGVELTSECLSNLTQTTICN